MTFGFNQQSDEDESYTGSQVHDQQVTLQDVVREVLDHNRLSTHELVADWTFTVFVLLCTVVGFGYTFSQFPGPGTSHAVYAISRQYPELAFLSGCLLFASEFVRGWVERHPFLGCWIGVFAGHSLWVLPL